MLNWVDHLGARIPHPCKESLGFLDFPEKASSPFRQQHHAIKEIEDGFRGLVDDDDDRDVFSFCVGEDERYGLIGGISVQAAANGKNEESY